MSKGIYEYDGKYAYSINLEKKIKRKKGARIVEIYEGDDVDLEKKLNEMLNKYLNESTNNDEEEKIILHHFIHKSGKSITTIYPDLRNIKNINMDEWKQID